MSEREDLFAAEGLDGEEDIAPPPARGTPVTRFFQSITGSSWSIIAILASLAISIVSFKTTFQGMTDYLGAEPPFGFALSFLLTFGVQSLLFIVSWLIAYAIFERRLFQTVSFTIIWAISMAVSVGFSFVDLYDGRLKAGGGAVEAQEAGRMGRATSLATDTILDLREQMDAQRTRIFKDFRSQDTYLTFKETEDRIRQLATNPPAEVADVFRRQLAQYKTERDDIIQARNTLAVDLSRVDQDIAAVQTAINQAQGELMAYMDSNAEQKAGAEKILVQLEPRVIALTQQVENEIAGRGSRYAETVGRPGCGRVCQELQRELNPLRLKVQEAKILVETITARERELQGKIDALETELVGLQGQRRGLLADTETPPTATSMAQGPGGRSLESRSDGGLSVPAATILDAQDQRLAFLDARIALFDGSNNPVRAISARIIENINAFEKNQDLDAFDEAIELCRRVAAMDGGAFVHRGRAPDDVCPGVQDNPVFAVLAGYNAQRARFDATCGGRTDEGLGQTLARLRSADDMFALTTTCIQESGLRGAAIDGLWADLRNKMQRWSPTASKTDKAYTALIEDKETAALMSFGIALVMDFLVLLVAIGGQQMQSVETLHREGKTDLFKDGMANLTVMETDSPRARSIKMFLKHCHFRGDGSGRVNLDGLSGDEYRDSLSTLHMLMANRQAFIQDEQQPSVITITKSGHRRLMTLLQRDPSQRARRDFTSPADRRYGPGANFTFWTPKGAAPSTTDKGPDRIFRGWPSIAANDSQDAAGGQSRPASGGTARPADPRRMPPRAAGTAAGQEWSLREPESREHLVRETGSVREDPAHGADLRDDNPDQGQSSSEPPRQQAAYPNLDNLYIRRS